MNEADIPDNRLNLYKESIDFRPLKRVDRKRKISTRHKVFNEGIFHYLVGINPFRSFILLWFGASCYNYNKNRISMAKVTM